MKSFVGSLAIVVATVVAGLARAEAQQSKVTLTTDRPVYKAGVSQVKITLTNGSSSTLVMSASAPWWIQKGDALVYSPVSLTLSVPIGVGQSVSWIWHPQTDTMSGGPAGKGTYTVTVEGLTLGTQSFQLSHQFALTSTGKVAGSTMFPLAVGDKWDYVKDSQPDVVSSSMEVTSKLSDSNWYKVENLLSGTRWAKRSGFTYPTLYTTSNPLSTSGAGPLFRFNRALGYTWIVNVAPQLTSATLKVGAVNETVVTPAGTFTGCYRIDHVADTVAYAGVERFWFAPGIGLVQYSAQTLWGGIVYRLNRAKVWCSTDGNFYTIGK